MISTVSACFELSRSRSSISSSAKPWTEVSGLRSSCEAVSTNSSFIRSSRARWEMSRTESTVPPSWAPSFDAVIARIASPSPRCSSFGSPPASRRSIERRSARLASSSRIGVPTSAQGTSRRAAGLASVTVPDSSRVITPSERLSSVTESRSRLSSRRR